MLRPSGKRKIPPRAIAFFGGAFQPSMKFMPLTRWTRRSPARPVPYSFQQRQRAKILGLKGTLGTSPCQVSQSRHLARRRSRSEEHTSELQSHLNLVCRLLLEKKKKG